MGRGSSGVSKSGGGAKFPATDAGAFRSMSEEETAEYLAKQTISGELQTAFDKYTDPRPEAGSLYNYSQNMNYAIANGTATKEQIQTFNEIVGGMHNLGYNATLTRYDHADTINDMLRQVGVSGEASRMTPTQLKRALSGVSYSDSRILSTSVNDFKTSSDPTTFATRQFKFTYRAKASVKGVMPGKGSRSKDDFGEMLLSPKSSYKIVDIKYSGDRARRKGHGKWDLSERQIEFIVEVE